MCFGKPKDSRDPVEQNATVRGLARELEASFINCPVDYGLGDVTKSRHHHYDITTSTDVPMDVPMNYRWRWAKLFGMFPRFSPLNGSSVSDRRIDSKAVTENPRSCSVTKLVTSSVTCTFQGRLRVYLG